MPTYESQTDRDAERQMLQWLAGFRNWDVIQTPTHCTYDAVMIDEGKAPQAIVEVKRRNCPMRQYATYMISLEKVLNNHSHAATLGVIHLLVVGWNCGSTGVYKWPANLKECFAENICQVVEGGRHDRPDAASDIEPVIHVPISQFNYQH